MVHGSGQRLFLPLALFSPTASISYLYSRRDIICAPLLHYALRITHYALFHQLFVELAVIMLSRTLEP